MNPFAALAAGRAAWALCGALASGLAGCSTPVTTYAPAQLLPVPAARRPAGVLRFADSRLCQGLGTEWDSALVVVAYKEPAFIRSLPVDNYWAVRGAVADQEYNEGTATLLFVKEGRYTAYCVFSRLVDWVGFVNAEAPATQVAWLTPRNCGRLSATGRRDADGTTSHGVRPSPP
ncbi:hypothetical protein [Hymenobacter arizonensis]|uniref:Lipoprotein n=1 Tax=Hymenobacter arizonensis TaxID=1227077 RepID=A0A1I6BR08_HYMAR|nr:hypothetical protein [Hymenobacter arizonensis]SFQ83297.1 hypothetical protein SAMN04515668_4942 [Hymenobacter arizonensis]